MAEGSFPGEDVRGEARQREEDGKPCVTNMIIVCSETISAKLHLFLKDLFVKD